MNRSPGSDRAKLWLFCGSGAWTGPSGFTSCYVPGGSIRPKAGSRSHHDTCYMTLAVTHAVDDGRTMRGAVPLLVGAFIYALLIAAGNGLLNDPDTMWQIKVGQ